jgi:hypothetical protein
MKELNKRALTSFLMLAGFLMMVISGVVLYIVPQGRIAYWVDWRLLGLTKADWGHIHTVAGLSILISAAFHIWFNWRALWHYAYDKVSQGLRKKREMAIAAIVTLVVVGSSIWVIPPLGSVVTLGEKIKESWIADPAYEPPFGHAEQLSLRAFTKKMGIDGKRAGEALRAQGIVFEGPEQSLEKIGRANDTSAMELYALIRDLQPQPEPVATDSLTSERIEERFAGTGVGRKTLRQICEETGVSPDVALERLSQEGIEAGADDKMKKIADAAGTSPIDLLEIVLLD